MNNQIQTFIEFLLDTETTSEVSFSEAILEKNEFYHKRHRSIFEKIVDQKIQQWKDFYQKEQNAIADRMAINAGNELSDNESDEGSSSDNDEEETPQSQPQQKDQVNLH